jgi:hypothetical protein
LTIESTLVLRLAPSFPNQLTLKFGSALPSRSLVV